jgi:hypothetical protein
MGESVIMYYNPYYSHSHFRYHSEFRKKSYLGSGSLISLISGIIRSWQVGNKKKRKGYTDYTRDQRDQGPGPKV